MRLPDSMGRLLQDNDSLQTQLTATIQVVAVPALIAMREEIQPDVI